MTINIIIGKNSFVTKAILNSIKKAEVFSANDFNNVIIKKIKSKKRINLIFNNFFPSKLLNDLSYKDYQKFEKLSLETITCLLGKLSPKKINKIIYTSSSAVYRLPENMHNQKKDEINRELYSSFKLTAEKIILNYCTKNNLNYHIFRLFNSFGNPEDPFSFIEKIIECKKNNKKIKLINNGNSIRDFIHVNDIGKIYSIFLNKKIKNGIFDLGTGNGYLIKDIINYLNFSDSKIIKKNNINEIYNSIADNKNLIEVIKKYNFINLQTYLKKRLNIKNKKIIKPVLKFKNQNQNLSSGVVIYGAGYAGKKIFIELKKINEDILFFVDDKISIQNTNYKGTSIISYENLLELKKNYNIKRIYLTIPSLDKYSQNRIIRKIKKNFFDVRYLSEKKNLLSDKIDVNDLKINDINNILNRKQINFRKINKLSNKTVLVTGAAGTIGSEICRQLVQHKVKKVIAIDKSELGIYDLQQKLKKEKIYYNLLDINDKTLLEKIIKDEKVQIIFHAAAYKHVNILENNIFSAVKNNIFATHNICDLSKKYTCEMIFISTDKAADPTSILGYTKKFAEKICENFNLSKLIKSKIKIVRFGNVFGSSGSAINNFMDKINNEEIVQITDKKASRYFMTITEACHLVLQTTSINSKKNIFILNMGKPINIFSLAKNLAKIKVNLNPNYKFKYAFTGLQPGEKLKETLKGKKEVLKMLNNEIFEVSQNYQTKESFNLYYKNLVTKYNEFNKKKLINHLKEISKY